MNSTSCVTSTIFSRTAAKPCAAAVSGVLGRKFAAGGVVTQPSSFNRYTPFNKTGTSALLKSSLISQTSARQLSLHEYQSKHILEKYGINVQEGEEADNVDDVYRIAKKLLAKGADRVVIKCQVLAGGRGKGHLSSGLQGGVKLCTTAEETREFARQMLGYRLTTHQTTAEGEMVKKVLIVDAADVVQELYLALLMDRAAHGPVAVVSKMGGMDIEDVAKTSPEAIESYPININKGLTEDLAKSIASGLGFDQSDADMTSSATEQVKRLYKLFIDTDATQVEINPLAVVRNQRTMRPGLVFLDAKLSFDDNAMYRQKALFDQEDKDTMDYRERAAEKAGLNFVGLDGSVGCLVNGAGLAMATMDIIKLHGGSPANFLDVGGGADEDQVKEAFKILQSDPNVKVLFVNIFGGIMKCDIIAQGLVEAAKSVDLQLPLVVRLVGNRVDVGKEIIRKSNFKNIQVVDDFESAAIAVVEAGKRSGAN